MKKWPSTIAILLFVVAFDAFAIFVSCSDGPDLIGPAQPAAVTAGASCAPPDAGPDCTCPDGGEIVVLPTCGVICNL